MVVDDEDNIVLREIRSDLGEVRADVGSIKERMTSYERHVEDIKESVAYSLGLSAHANVAYETTGQRLDRLTEQVAGLRARVEELEKR